MSKAYVVWAKTVRVGTRDKFVLKTIAERVDHQGIWQFKLKDLTEELEMSRNTLRAALDRLCKRQLLAFKAVAYRGKAQAGHKFRLLRDDAERREAELAGFAFRRALLDRSGRTAGGPELTEGTLTEGGSPGLTEGRSTMSDRQRKKQNSDSKLLSSPEPASPIWARRRYPEAFERFWSGFPTHENMSKSSAFMQWSYLTANERRDAYAALPSFKHRCATQPTTRPLHARTYLAERRWEGHLLAADGERPVHHHLTPSRVFVEKDSPQWRAWLTHRQVKSFAECQPTSGGPFGWHFPSEWPPSLDPVEQPAIRETV